MSYQGPALDLLPFFADIKFAATNAGFFIETYGEAAGWPLLLLRRNASDHAAPTLYISTGIHGDEPAGPLALLQLLREGALDLRYHWLLFPALNPGGLAVKTRENPAGVDVNRDYCNSQTPEARQHTAWLVREEMARRRYDMCICLHEDWETSGYYLYELNGTSQPLYGNAILAAVESVCGVDRSPIIEGMEAKNGLITRPVDDLRSRPVFPEAIYLVLKHTHRCLTLEAPSAQDLPRRVTAHATGVKAAIAEWEKGETK
jgi:hypothetical protein